MGEREISLTSVWHGERVDHTCVLSISHASERVQSCMRALLYLFLFEFEAGLRDAVLDLVGRRKHALDFGDRRRLRVGLGRYCVRVLGRDKRLVGARHDN